MKKLVLIHGSPGVGKSVLATELYGELSKKGHSVHYVQEYIKDLANRKYKIDPMDQVGIFGNQTMLVNGAILGDYDYISCCSSPMLCSFYANHYSNNAFPALVDMTKDWLRYIKSTFNIEIHNYFLYLDREEYFKRFKQNGRYEGLEEAMVLQDVMLGFFKEHFPAELIYESDVQYLLGKLEGVSHDERRNESNQRNID